MLKNTLAAILIIVFASCAKCDYISIYDSALGLTMLDSATGKYVYALSSPLLKKDSVLVTDERGERMDTWFYETNAASGERFEVLGIRILTNDQASGQAALSSTVTKKFNIYLSSTASAQLDVSFTGKEVKCGNTIKAINIVQHGKVIATGSDLVTNTIVRVKL